MKRKLQLVNIKEQKLTNKGQFVEETLSQVEWEAIN